MHQRIRLNQWYEAQGKPWTLFRSKLQGMNPKLLVRRSKREAGFSRREKAT